MNGIMKRGVIVFVFIAVFSCFACAGDKPESRLITVTGEGEVRVAPDEAILTVGVETWDKDLGVAKRQNDERVRRVLALAKKYNIDSKRVQTDYLRIEPRYKNGHKREDFIGFFVTKTVVFTLRDMPKFEELLSNALLAGANYVHGVQFRTTRLRDYREEARSLALKAAREKAKDMARELGQKVGKPWFIVEEQYERDMSQNIVQNTGGGPLEADASFAAGQISVRAAVRVSFELR